MTTSVNQPRWKQPRVLLFIMAAAMPFSMGTWMALINNFSIEYAHFDGADISKQLTNHCNYSGWKKVKRRR